MNYFVSTAWNVLRVLLLVKQLFRKKKKQIRSHKPKWY